MPGRQEWLAAWRVRVNRPWRSPTRPSGDDLGLFVRCFGYARGGIMPAMASRGRKSNPPSASPPPAPVPAPPKVEKKAPPPPAPAVASRAGAGQGGGNGNRGTPAPVRREVPRGPVPPDATPSRPPPSQPPRAKPGSAPAAAPVAKGRGRAGDDRRPRRRQCPSHAALPRAIGPFRRRAGSELDRGPGRPAGHGGDRSTWTSPRAGWRRTGRSPDPAGRGDFRTLGTECRRHLRAEFGDDARADGG